MKFVDEINQIQDNFDTKVAKIKEEIIDYFKKYLYGDVFKNALRNEITYKIERGESTINLIVEFHKYSPGCGETYISCFSRRFSLQGDETKIDGIDLQGIHQPICRTIYRMLSDRIEELGFRIVTTGVKESRFGCFREYITIAWKGEK